MLFLPSRGTRTPYSFSHRPNFLIRVYDVFYVLCQSPMWQQKNNHAFRHTHPEARQWTCTSLSPELLQYENIPEGSQVTLGWKKSSVDWPVIVRTRKLLPARHMIILEVSIAVQTGGATRAGRDEMVCLLPHCFKYTRYLCTSINPQSVIGQSPRVSD